MQGADSVQNPGRYLRMRRRLRRTPRSLHLKVWAVREGTDTLNVLVINKGARSTTVNLHLPGTGPGSVQRLLAPRLHHMFGSSPANAVDHCCRRPWCSLDQTAALAEGSRVMKAASHTGWACRTL
jgi:hypothetical protein